MTHNRTYIAPVGGIGNQLFQYIAGLNASGENALYIDLTLANTRTKNNSIPPIKRIQHPSNVNFFYSRGKKNVNAKLYLYLLRVSTNPTRWESSRFWRFATTFFGSLYFSLVYSDWVKVQISKGIGFDPLNSSRISRLLIGYFQSYEYLLGLVTSKPFEVKHLEKSPVLDSLIAKSENEKILMIHVRLGDYLSESRFGNLDRNFYRTALQIQFDLMNYDRIWVFSEDLEEARSFIPDLYLGKCKWIDDIDGDEIYSLIAMQRCDGYIIANSSFSWWGAMLSTSENPVIIAPRPWFSKIPSPNRLVPSSWYQLASHD